ncbi:MAG: hypothetical protein RR415_10275 [Ruthenibacterium sp.]
MKELFEECIKSKLSDIRGEYLDLVSADIHLEVGGYPSSNHRMPTCCQAMYNQMKGDDKVIYAPNKGTGATLKIRYYKRNR